MSARISVRHIVSDVPSSVAFYSTHLGFELQQDASPAFAAVTLGELRLLLSGPTSSGARPMPDGRRPVPGGWNRIELATGSGGSQILIDDPDGNPIGLFQPAR